MLSRNIQRASSSRTILIPKASAGQQQLQQLLPRPLSFQRSLVYVRNGQVKARGLKKDESQYLTTPNGTTYPGTETTLKSAKDFLGADYQIPDNVVLQALTHKSFAHAKKPFNEKLAILGKEYLRLSTFQHAVSRPNGNTLAVNGQNFDIMPKAIEILSSSKTLAEICRRASISNDVFWKNPANTEANNAETTVYARVIHALVGAVLVHHGESKAASFVNDRLLSGPYNVIAASEGQFKA